MQIAFDMTDWWDPFWAKTSILLDGGMSYLPFTDIHKSQNVENWKLFEQKRLQEIDEFFRAQDIP